MSKKEEKKKQIYGSAWEELTDEKQTIDTCDNMDECDRLYIEQKKVGRRDYICTLCGSIYIKNRDNWYNIKEDTSEQMLAFERWGLTVLGRRKFLVWEKYFPYQLVCIHCQIMCIHNLATEKQYMLSKLTKLHTSDLCISLYEYFILIKRREHDHIVSNSSIYVTVSPVIFKAEPKDWIFVTDNFFPYSYRSSYTAHRVQQISDKH